MCNYGLLFRFRKMERKILNISIRDRIKNTEVRRRTQVKDAATAAQVTKWRWAGHVASLNINNWTKIATVWDPRDGERGPRRPRIRWADESKRNAGHMWIRFTRYRDAWKNHEQFYT